MSQIIRLTENDIHNIVSHCINRLIQEGSESSEEIHMNGDLGLPSGTIWMEQNVGASSPSDYGKFFAWGTQDGFFQDEIDNKVLSAKWYKQQELVNWNGYTFEDGSHAPSKEQIAELAKNTIYKFVTYQGTKGGLFTSKINGNSIFIPACGFIYNMSKSKQPLMYNQEGRGYTWSCDLYNKNNGLTLYLDDYPSKHLYSLNTYYGIPIRGVK